jgi:hypothetical protein
MNNLLVSVSQAPDISIENPSWDDVLSLLDRITQRSEAEPSIECVVHDVKHQAKIRLAIIYVHASEGHTGLGWLVELKWPLSGHPFVLRSTDTTRGRDQSRTAALLLGCPELISRACILPFQEMSSRTRDLCCGAMSYDCEQWVPLDDAILIE